MTEQVKPPARPEPAKDVSPREAAAIRAAQIRDHDKDVGDGTDEFAIHVDVPEGWSYEWKRKEVLGAPDHAYDVSVARRGWTPVSAKRHPEMMPMGYTDTTITRKGMILMERPQAITDEAREKENRLARMQVRVKEQQLSQSQSGEFERQNKGDPLVKIRKSVEPMQIPE
jgi:hypothetical protein